MILIIVIYTEDLFGLETRVGLPFAVAMYRNLGTYRLCNVAFEFANFGVHKNLLK